MGGGRQATLELSAAYGISRESRDLVALAEGYEAMGALEQARNAYRRALAGDLDSRSSARVRERLERLGLATAKPNTGSKVDIPR